MAHDPINNNDTIDAEVGSWPEYRRYVVAQLRETAVAIAAVREAIAEQKIKMAALGAELRSVIDGTINKRIEVLEATLSWGKGIGAVLMVLWSILLIFLTRWFK